MTKLYGIPNCDTVKKARKYLESHGIDYSFHDFRKDPLNESDIEDWLTHLPWEQLTNKRSTSFRQLSDEQKATFSSEHSKSLLVEQPTLIKRPVLEYQGKIINGFKAELYAEFLGLK